MKKKKVILWGYMGSGKSTVGQQLAQELDIKFHDLDKVIEYQEQISIPKIFEEKGAIYFRKKETQVLNDFLNEKTEYVLALGGGTPCYGNNLETIKKHSDKNIYLKLNVNSLFQRLRAEKQERPIISEKNDEELAEFIGKHLFERNVFYQQANHILDCDGKSPLEVVSEIRDLI